MDAFRSEEEKAKDRKIVAHGVGKALRRAHRVLVTDKRMQELIETLNKVGGRNGDSR